MKTYKFEVTIDEGYDEFWESLENKTGVEEITEWLEEALEEYFHGLASAQLIEFNMKVNPLDN